MPWSVESEAAQRLEFCVLADGEGEVSFVELCRRYGIAPKTGYKWLNRYRERGEAGLMDRSRAPHTSPARTSAEMEEVVCALRRKHSAWVAARFIGCSATGGMRGCRLLPPLPASCDVMGC